MLPLLALVFSQSEQGASITPKITQICSASSFKFPDIDGTAPISITAVPTYNYSASSFPPGSINLTVYTISFCNVSVTLQAVGGGGYSASFGSLYMTQAVGNGYIALDTDAGHLQGLNHAQSPKEWVLESPGKVNTHLVDNWGSTSLHEMAVIGKAVSESYYGTKPKYSYFTGCSGGGRQAMMIAQMYTDDFDSIIAAAPAINIENFIPAGYWASQIMLDLGAIPAPCELEAFTQAAVDACNAMDGAEDGIISLPALCKFDPHSIIS
ncbi:tannase and feruloyl esterase-domain-containing protein [Ilyonectria destructans]|nr:tannase and feruloyl esterase-domain-containing protein [Ilyonectria destructans]